MNLTDLLKRVPMFARLNATRRALQIERRYERLARHYTSEPTSNDFADLWSQRGLESLSLSHVPRVLFCGTDELQDLGGFIQALDDHSDLRLLRRANGEYGQSVNGIAWSENAVALSDTLERLRGSGWTPEVVMMQSMGYRFHPADLQNLKRRYGFIIINVGMDERLAYQVGRSQGVELGIAGLNEVVDLTLVTVPEAVHWYAVEKVPAKYFPLASSAEVYFPRPEVPKLHDVGFIGRAYGRRVELAKKIRASGLSFRAHGPGWDAGPLKVQENNEFYNSCRVVLGTGNIGYSKKLMNPKLRDFEVALTGVPYVTNYTPELAQLFTEDFEIVLYRTENELISKLNWLVRNPDTATKIGTAGYRRAVNEHQYGVRFDVLFNRVLRGNPAAEFVTRERA